MAALLAYALWKRRLQVSGMSLPTQVPELA
jgi:hypothetical protein